jgi:hypothetical protein
LSLAQRCQVIRQPNARGSQHADERESSHVDVHPMAEIVGLISALVLF